MRRVSYAPLSTMREEQAKVEKVATNRRKRLNKEENNWGLAIVLDLLLGIGPWVVGACALAVGLWAVHKYVPGAPEVFLKFSAPAAIAAVSTFSVFLLVNKITANLASNATIVTEFNNLTGSLINLALWVKSQKVPDKTTTALREYDDGSGQKYVTNQISMTLSSVPYIVKYVGRGVDIWPEGLPIGQDADLVKTYKRYAAKNTQGSTGSMTPFTVAVLMLGEQIDQIQRGEKKDTEYAVLFAQLNAITNAEGTIAACSGYNPPYIMDALIFVVFGLFLVLTLVSDLIPNNGANAVWIAAIVSFCTIGFYQVSDRYWNPMALRSKRSGQEPLISKMCVSTELAITSIFAQQYQKLSEQPGALAVTAETAAAVPTSGFHLRFN